MADAPIGIVDSGVGGLTVARAVLDLLPHEPLLYLGDTARGPYGPLPIATVRSHALETMDLLVDRGVKALVIACNSASSAVLRDARERYSLAQGVPVVEVIAPAVRRSVATTRAGRIGVIGTQATISSRAYDDSFAAAPHLHVTSAACPRFVDFVEAGATHGAELEAVARGYLQPLIDQDVDTLVLGCTHYPLLAGVISYVMGTMWRLCPARTRRLARSSARCASMTFFAATICPRPGISSWPPVTRRPSRWWLAASSDRRYAWWTVSDPRCSPGRRLHETDHRGLLGFLSRA